MVLELSPESAYEVVVIDASWVPSLYTLYPVTPTLSVDASQLQAIELEFAASALNPDGTLGGVVSAVTVLLLLPPPPLHPAINTTNNNATNQFRSRIFILYSPQEFPE